MTEPAGEIAAHVAHWTIDAQGQLVRREKPLDGCPPGPCTRSVDEFSMTFAPEPPTSTPELAELLARESYRALYPGAISPGREHTRESDIAEMRRAYQTWDQGRAGFTPTRRCNLVAARLTEVIARDWLPGVLRAAQVKAWDEGAAAGAAHMIGESIAFPLNPYRADRIEGQ